MYINKPRFLPKIERVVMKREIIILIVLAQHILCRYLNIYKRICRQINSPSGSVLTGTGARLKGREGEKERAIERESRYIDIYILIMRENEKDIMTLSLSPSLIFNQL